MIFEEMKPKICENDDSIMQSLNNLLLMLQYGDHHFIDELPEVKILLQQAYLDYENLMSFVRQKQVEENIKNYLKRITE